MRYKPLDGREGQPVPGYPAINVFGNGKPFSVPAGLTNGVRVSVDWPQGLPGLQPFTIERLPPPVKAAVYLNFALFSAISPPEDSPPKVNVTTGESKTVRIDVGKKP